MMLIMTKMMIMMKNYEPCHCLDIKDGDLKIVVEASSLIIVSHQQHLQNVHNYCHDKIIIEIKMIRKS